MSVVVKEYSCPVHGYFESVFSVCPTCGTTQVKRVFVTPPAFKGDATKMKDNELNQLTMAYGMTDYSNNESTKHTNDHAETWATPQTAAQILSASGITLREPTAEERKKVTPLRPAPINTALKGRIGKYEAIHHKEGDKGLRP